MTTRSINLPRRGVLQGSLVLMATGMTAGVGCVQRNSYPQGEPMKLDLAGLEPGRLLTVQWAQRPVWVLRRTPADLTRLVAHEAELTDAESAQSIQPPTCVNRHRAIAPALFVAVGICTHQGCTPQLQTGAGFLCPCHASRYDLAGRVFRAGPAPANLTILAYHFAADNQLVLGRDG